MTAACIVPALAGAQSLYPGQFEEKRVVKDAVESEIRCFDLSDVRLLPGRFHDNMLRDSAWLASIGTDGMTAPSPFSDPSKYNDYYTYDYRVPADLNPVLVLPDGNVGKSLKKESELVFETVDGRLLKPLYDTHHQRYVVYWDI